MKPAFFGLTLYTVSSPDVFDPEKWSAWIQQHENEAVSDIALRYSGRKELPLQDLLVQLKGRQIARLKIPSFYAQRGIYYPDTLILEQCSSEDTARLKADWAKDKTVADLTGGLGVDAFAFSRKAKRVLFCEPDTRRCEAAKHNFRLLGAENIEVIQGDAAQTASLLHNEADVFYLDPARRSNNGKRAFLPEDLSPNIVELKAQLLESGALVMVKMAPMLDLQQGLRQLPETFRVEVVSRKNECRELVFFLSAEKRESTITCIDAEHPERAFTYDPQKDLSLPLPLAAPDTYLFEPDASIRKAGPWRSICADFSINTLHPNSHLFTGKQELPAFPGRCFRVKAMLPYQQEKILEALGGQAAQLVFYNFPVDAEQVRKKLRIPSGEPNYLFFTRTPEGPVVLLTERTSSFLSEGK